MAVAASGALVMHLTRTEEASRQVARMASGAAKLSVDETRLRHDGRVLAVYLAVVAAGVLAAAMVPEAGPRGGTWLWLGLGPGICLLLPATPVLRQYLWGRRYRRRETALGDNGLAVTEDGQLLLSVGWESVTSIAGDDSRLVVRFERGSLLLYPRLCSDAGDFMLTLRRQFHAHRIVDRLRLRELSRDLMSAGLWMVGLLAIVSYPLVRYAPIVMAAAETADEQAYWSRVITLLCVLAPAFAAFVAGLRASYTWGAHGPRRGLPVALSASALAFGWSVFTFRAWLSAEGLAWHSLLAAGAALMAGYAGAWVAGYKVWSQDHVAREAGLAALPEAVTVRMARRGVMLGNLAMAIAVGSYQVFNVVYFGHDAFVPRSGVPRATDFGLAIFGVLFAAGMLWLVAYCVGLLRHEAIRISPECFEYWDWRDRRHVVAWSGITRVDRYPASSLVIRYRDTGKDRALKLDTAGWWRSGLLTQVITELCTRARLAAAAKTTGRRLRASRPVQTFIRQDTDA